MPTSPHEFPRSKRLLTPGDFRGVFDQVAAKAGCPEILILCHLQTPAKENGRIGFIIAKKAVKRANQRNRIKRIFRENFRQLPNELKGLDMIIMGKKGADQLSNAELHKLAQKIRVGGIYAPYKIVAAAGKYSFGKPISHLQDIVWYPRAHRQSSISISTTKIFEISYSERSVL